MTDAFVQLTLFKRYVHRRYYLPISLMNYTIPRPRKEVIWMLGMMALAVSPSPPSYSLPAQGTCYLHVKGMARHMKQNVGKYVEGVT
jgi:hypothetical protein